MKNGRGVECVPETICLSPSVTTYVTDVTDVDTHIWNNFDRGRSNRRGLGQFWARHVGGSPRGVGGTGRSGRVRAQGRQGGQSVCPGISDEGSFVDVRVECVPESRGSV